MFFGALYTFCILCSWKLVKGQIRHVIINSSSSDYYSAAYSCLHMNGTMATIETVRYHRMCLIEKRSLNDGQPLKFWIGKYLGAAKDSNLKTGDGTCTYVQMDRDGSTMCQEVGCRDEKLPSLCEIDHVLENRAEDQCQVYYTTSSIHTISSSVDNVEHSTIQASYSTSDRYSGAAHVKPQKQIEERKSMIWITIVCLLASIVFIVLATITFCNRKLRKRKHAINTGQPRRFRSATDGTENDEENVEYSISEPHADSAIYGIGLPGSTMNQSPRTFSFTQVTMPEVVYNETSVIKTHDGRHCNIYELANAVPSEDINASTQQIFQRPQESSLYDHDQTSVQCHNLTGRKQGKSDNIECIVASDEDHVGKLNRCGFHINNSLARGEECHSVGANGAYFTLEKEPNITCTGSICTVESVHYGDDDNPYLEPRSVDENIAHETRVTFMSREENKVDGMNGFDELKKNSDSEKLQRTDSLTTINDLGDNNIYHTIEDNEVVYHMIKDNEVSPHVGAKRVCQGVCTEIVLPNPCRSEICVGNSVAEVQNIYHLIEDRIDPRRQEGVNKFQFGDEAEMRLEDKYIGTYSLLRRSNRNVSNEGDMGYSTCPLILK